MRRFRCEVKSQLTIWQLALIIMSIIVTLASSYTRLIAFELRSECEHSINTSGGLFVLQPENAAF